MDTIIVAQTDITPLFKVVEIQFALFSMPSIEPLNVSAFDLLTPKTINIDDNRGRIKFAEI
jgi:hypothetical protein